MNKNNCIFTVFCLISFSFSSFCMKKDMEKSENTDKVKKIKKRVLVLQSFLNIARRYPTEKNKRKEALDIFTNNAFKVWKNCAISEKDKMGKVSGAAVSNLIDFDAIEKDEKNLKDPIRKLIEKRVNSEDEEIKPVTEKKYVFDDVIFKKVMKNFSIESQKRLLWLGVELAQTEDGKQFKEIISKVMSWTSWIPGVKTLIYYLLVRQSDWIEGEIDKIVVKSIDLSKGK